MHNSKNKRKNQRARLAEFENRELKKIIKNTKFLKTLSGFSLGIVKTNFLRTNKVLDKLGAKADLVLVLNPRFRIGSRTQKKFFTISSKDIKLNTIHIELDNQEPGIWKEFNNGNNGTIIYSGSTTGLSFKEITQTIVQKL